MKPHVTNKDRAERARMTLECSDYDDPMNDSYTNIKDLITDMMHLLMELYDGKDQQAIETVQAAIRMFEIEVLEDE